jgi:hypothetical protein
VQAVRNRGRKRAREIGRRTVSIGDRMSIDDRMTPASIDARRSIHGSWSVEDLRSTEGSEGRDERIVAPRIDPCAVEYIVRCVPKSPAESAKLEPAPRSGSDNPPTRPDLYAAHAQGVRVVRRCAREQACAHFQRLWRDGEAPGSAGRLLLIVACMFSMLKPWSAREMYSSPGFRSGTCFCVVRYIPRAVGMRYCDSRGAWAGGGKRQCMGH